MRTFLFTHNNGRVEEIEGNHLLDAVFRYRGNYFTLKSATEKEKIPEPAKVINKNDEQWHGTDNNGWTF